MSEQLVSTSMPHRPDAWCGRVIALSYPLLGPGSSRELLATGLPMLVVQGGRDPYGRPAQFPSLPTSTDLIEVPYANHTFGVPAAAGVTAVAALTSITAAVTNWLEAPRRTLPARFFADFGSRSGVTAWRGAGMMRGSCGGVVCHDPVHRRRRLDVAVRAAGG
jgi:hypothetical protein